MNVTTLRRGERASSLVLALVAVVALGSALGVPGCASVTHAVRTFAEDVADITSSVEPKRELPELERVKVQKAIDLVGENARRIATIDER